MKAGGLMLNLYTTEMLDRMRREDARRSRTHAELEREAAKGRVHVTRTLNLEWLSRPFRFMSRSRSTVVRPVQLKTT